MKRCLRGIDEQQARQMSISGRADEHQRAWRSAWQPRTGAGHQRGGKYAAWICRTARKAVNLVTPAAVPTEAPRLERKRGHKM